MAQTNLTVAEAWQALASAQKPRAGALPYTLFVNRPIGRVLAVTSYKIRLSPDHITLISAAITYASFIYMVTLGYRTLTASAIGVALLLVGYALDSADGQLARLAQKQTVAGEWLDHTADNIKIAMFHISIVVVIFQIGTNVNAITLYALLLIGVLNSGRFFSTMLKEQLRKRANEVSSVLTNLKGILLSPFFDYGLMCFIFLFSPTGLLFSVYAVWGGLTMLLCVIAFYRSYQQLSNLKKPQMISKS